MKKSLLGIVGLVVSSVAAACGSDSADSNFGNADGDGGASSSGSSGDPGGFGSSGDNDGGGLGTSSGDGGSDFSRCARSTQKVEVVPIDMSLLVDTSGSMDYKAANSDVVSKWVNVKNALKAFSANPAYDNLGVSLQFFPKTLTCDVSGYGMPELPFATLPNAAVGIFASLNAQGMSGGTPTTQALQGMVQYTRTHAAAQTNRKSVVVLATDGVPDPSCTGNTVADAVEEARLAFVGTPPIPVYVIGIGQNGADESVMNRIAAAGGTTQAELVTAGSDIEASFLAALNKIRKTAISCDYPLPAGQSDIAQVNVQFRNGTTNDVFLYAATPEQCAGAADRAWTVDNSAAPTKVVLCPDTCTRVKAADAGQIDVVFGCPRIDVR